MYFIDTPSVSVLHIQTFLPEALPVFTFLKLYVTFPGSRVGELGIITFYDGKILRQEIALMNKTK